MTPQPLDQLTFNECNRLARMVPARNWRESIKNHTAEAYYSYFRDVCIKINHIFYTVDSGKDSIFLGSHSYYELVVRSGNFELGNNSSEYVRLNGEAYNLPRRHLSLKKTHEIVKSAYAKTPAWMRKPKQKTKQQALEQARRLLSRASRQTTRREPINPYG